MELFIAFFIGLAVGAGAGIGIWVTLNKSTREHEQKVAQQLQMQFQQLSQDVLSKNTEQFLTIAKERLGKESETNQTQLEHKKSLINNTLEHMKKELDKVHITVKELERDRQQKYGEISNHLKLSSLNAQKLTETTTQLKEALASSKTRGQWGERMAEDVLRLTGLREGINYVKQKSINEVGAGIPDFTFILPNHLKVNMDVKFPLNNYLNYINAQSDNDRAGYRDQFMKDVRARVKEVTNRGYINKETVDYVLIFIPNEDIFAFMNEQDLSLIDTALQQKVVFCSPLTLYAMLSIIDKATKDFAREQKATEILGLVDEFKKQWDKYKESMDKMGRSIESARRDFENLVGTRNKALERPLEKLSALEQDPLDSPVSTDEISTPQQILL